MLGRVVFTSSTAEVGADPVAGVFSVVRRDRSWARRRAAGWTVLPGAVLAGGLSDMVI